MLTLETQLYQMHLLTNRKALTTNKIVMVKKKIRNSLLSFMIQYKQLKHFKQLFLVVVYHRRPSIKTTEYCIALTLFMCLTSLGRKRRYSDQVKVLYAIFWLCFYHWEFCHEVQYCKDFTMCGECPRDSIANAAKMQLWRS